MKYNRSAYVKCYSVLAQISKRYYPMCDRNMFFFQKMIEEYRLAELESEEEFPSEFPSEFFERTANAIVHWFLNEFRGIYQPELVAKLQELWAFHKKYLSSDWAEKDLNEACDYIQVLKNKIGTPEELLKLYTAVLEDIQRVYDGQGDNSQGDAKQRSIHSNQGDANG